MNIKQDINMSRKPVDLETKYQLTEINPMKQDVEEIKEKVVVDSFLSTTSTHSVQNKVITEALNNKANKEEGKGLSTNDFTDEEKNKLTTIEANAEENKIEKIYISGEELSITNKGVNIYVDDYVSDYSTNPIQNKVIKSYVDEKTGSSSSTYNLANYKVSGLTILRSSCVVKNYRVCINFVGTISMNANATTTIFNLPSAICPMATKDFVVFGQSSNNDGYIGYGYVTADGLMQVRFNTAISSYIRFNFIYDLD